MTNEAAVLLAGNLALIAAVAFIGAWLLFSGARRMSPSFADLEVAYSELTEQMSVVREQQAGDHATIRQLQMDLSRVEADNAELRRAFLAVVNEYTADIGRPPKTQLPGPKLVAARPVTSREPARLRRLMIEAFDLSEIDGLAFELGLGDGLKGQSVEERAQSLVGQASRRGLLNELITLCRRDRPEGGF